MILITSTMYHGGMICNYMCKYTCKYMYICMQSALSCIHTAEEKDQPANEQPN